MNKRFKIIKICKDQCIDNLDFKKVDGYIITRDFLSEFNDKNIDIIIDDSKNNDKIDDILIDLGFKYNSVNYLYIKEIINQYLLIVDPINLKFCNLCEYAADKYYTSANNVDKLFRYSLKNAFKNNKSKWIEKYHLKNLAGPRDFVVNVCRILKKYN